MTLSNFKTLVSQKGIRSRKIIRFTDRRLFDTKTKTFLTAKELAKIAGEESKLIVADKDTGKNITQSFLKEMYFLPTDMQSSSVF